MPGHEHNSLNICTHLCICRLPGHPPQRRRFGGEAPLGQVYAWAQLALLQGLCPTMDARLAQLSRTGSPDSNSSRDGVGSSIKSDASSGGGGGGSDILLHNQSADSESGSAKEGAADLPPPAEADEAWVQRWAEAAAGSSSLWAWHDGGWRLAQMYPRQQLPRSGATVVEAGLVPQAALAVERQ